MSNSNGYRFLDPAALARVKNLSVIARGVVEGFISGMHSSPYHGFSVEFAEHRDYTPGDNIRYLDWRMLARTDRLYVKQYEEETNLRAQIVLDTSASMLYRANSKLSKLSYGAYLTAVLAYLMTRQQDAVGLTTFDEQLQFDMPARTSPFWRNDAKSGCLVPASGGNRYHQSGTWNTHCRYPASVGRTIQTALPDRADQRSVR
jgi:hypothetical protein